MESNTGNNEPSTVALTKQELSEVLNNVFDLPSIEQTIRYLHASIGFPTRRTWIKAIQSDNFVGWPLVTVKNVNKYFPESKETAKGHTNHQQQGERSTRVHQKDIEEVDTTTTKNKKECDVYTK